MASIDYIDYVAEVNSPSAIEAIKQIKPNYYCKGQEYKNFKNDITKKIKDEIRHLEKNNGKIIYTNEVTFSSSKILNDLELLLIQNN